MYRELSEYNHADYIAAMAIHFQTVPVIFPLISKEKSPCMKSYGGVTYFADNGRSI